MCAQLGVKATENVVSTVGGRLRRFLTFAGLSIRDFSKRTGVPYRTLQNYLAGNRLPDAEHLGRLAGAGIDINWLLTGELRPAMLPVLRDGADAEGIEAVGADTELLARLSLVAQRDADGYAARILDRTGAPLRPSQGLAAIAYYLRLRLRTAAGLARHIETLRRDGYSTELIVDILTGALPAALDAEVDRFIEASKAPQ